MVFIAHNPQSMRHDVPGHPETAARAAAILKELDADPMTWSLPRLTPDRGITREEARRTHSARLWLNLDTIGPHVPAYLDPDTYVVQGSVEAARLTARLSMQAVDRTMADGEPGFVVARPPGHHATHDRSMGFCLFNNVAVAAHRALDLGAERVLIFDHDVHHGNGTQDLFYGTDQVLYQSFHLENHYPGTGRVEEVGEAAGEGFTVNAPLRPGDGDAQVRSLVRDVFVPVAKEFRPDLVLFSSGFDSLEGDPLGGLRLSPAFYGELVQEFRSASPKIICFLEGGYQLDKIPLAALAQVKALSGVRPDADTFAQAPDSQAPLERALAPHWSSLR